MALLGLLLLTLLGLLLLLALLRLLLGLLLLALLGLLLGLLLRSLALPIVRRTVGPYAGGCHRRNRDEGQRVF